jgi:hypothetical protein
VRVLAGEDTSERIVYPIATDSDGVALLRGRFLSVCRDGRDDPEPIEQEHDPIFETLTGRVERAARGGVVARSALVFVFVSVSVSISICICISGKQSTEERPHRRLVATANRVGNGRLARVTRRVITESQFGEDVLEHCRESDFACPVRPLNRGLDIKYLSDAALGSLGNRLIGGSDCWPGRRHRALGSEQSKKPREVTAHCEETLNTV